MKKPHSLNSRIADFSRQDILRYILQDNPIDAEHDCLGASRICEIIVNIILQLEKDNIFSGNVALYAPWGSGKTSTDVPSFMLGATAAAQARANRGSIQGVSDGARH